MELTTAELANTYDIHPTMISGGRRAAIANMAATSGGASSAEPQISADEVEKLHTKIGQLVIERDFGRQPAVSLSGLAAKSGETGSSRHERSAAMQPAVSGASGPSDQPRGESAENLIFMDIIDRQLLETPWYGARQMARHMQREGHQCGRHQ